MIRSSSKNWTFVSPRSSAALTESIVGAFAVISAPAAGDAQASVGGRSSNAPPGVAWICTFSQLGEIVSSVSASTVSVPPLQITVSGEPSRELIMSSCEAPSRMSAPSPPVMIALAGLHGQAVGASVAGDRDRLRVDVGRGLDVLDVGADQVVLARGTVVARGRRARTSARSACRRSRCRCRRRRPSCRCRCWASDRRCRRRRAACRCRRSRRCRRRRRRRRCVSLRAPPASTSLPSPPVMIAGIDVRPRKVSLLSTAAGRDAVAHVAGVDHRAGDARADHGPGRASSRRRR